MEKETKVTDIKNLRKSISAAKAKVEAEEVKEEVAETVEEVVETAPVEVEEVNEVVSGENQTVKNAESEDEDEEIQLTEQEIFDAIRKSFPNAPEKYEPAPFLKQLLDPNDNSPIEFESVDGQKASFEQVALIPRDDKLYAILKPIDFEAFNIKEDEALVYSVEYDELYYQDYLQPITDEVDIEIIFQMYYDLLDEQGIE